MKNCVFIILSFMAYSCFSQDNFKLYYQETSEGYDILADNDEYATISIKVNFNLENLSSSKDGVTVFVIPPRTKKHIISNLVVIDKSKRVKLSYETKYNFGDHTLDDYDTDFKYVLPYKKGQTFGVSQGYNGEASHKNLNAIDFEMPNGTPICASRGGVVIGVEQQYSKSCIDPSCVKYNNFIKVFHDDGTFAEYSHIKQDGSIVKVGEKIIQGQVIGYSGDVGFATGAHLHFVVFFQKLDKQISLKTKFVTDKKDSLVTLSKDKMYKRMF